ncbi:MAG: Txe/YoeB family addiction module toxin [Acutalibacteraceae bacterium]
MFSKAAVKDAENLKAASLDAKAKRLLRIIEINPFQSPPPYEKLIGDLSGMYSRRINIQHRLVYTVDEQNKIIRVLRMWKHYEKI